MSRSIDISNKRILISRTDSIGDVMLTLPICVWLKKKFPTCTIVFLGKTYTKAVIDSCAAVDEFVDFAEIQNKPTLEKVSFVRELNLHAVIHVFPQKEIANLARRAKIAHRIGTSHRAFHLLTCNHRINFTRKNSPLHEAQLNFQLLKNFGCNSIPTMEELNTITAHFKAPQEDLPVEVQQLLENNNKKVILHAKSQGSAIEWGLNNYHDLCLKLLEKGYSVYYTGTENEGDMIRKSIPKHVNCHDTTGKLSLPQLIHFISKVDGLIACSTGPLHIAGFLNINAVGLFSPRKPIHAGRWQPLGSKVNILVFDENCPSCKKQKSCDCMQKITTDQVLNVL